MKVVPKQFLFLCGPLLLALLCLPWAGHSATVAKLSWDAQTSRTRFLLQLDEPVKYNPVDSIKEKGYYYVDIYGMTRDYRPKRFQIDGSALVDAVESLSYPEHHVLRLVFYLKTRDANYLVTRNMEPFQLMIDTVPGGSASAPSAAGGTDGVGEMASLGSGSPPVQTNVGTGNVAAPPIPAPRNKTRTTGGAPKKIIIDAGHGGANNGATSSASINGRQVLEKDLTLQFAYQLKRVIDAAPNMTALLTRSDDSTVRLGDRVAFAEGSRGDLFISLHTNDGGGNPNARGIEFFFLSEKGTVDGATKALEELENMDVGESSRPGESPILKSILTDLSRDKLEDWQYESWLMCRRLQDELAHANPFFRQNCRGIKSANFVVLKNFYMPAVLVEVGFITNSTDLRYLVNPQFQQQTAVAIFNALNRYFSEVDPEFKAQRMTLTSSQGPE